MPRSPSPSPWSPLVACAVAVALSTRAPCQNERDHDVATARHAAPALQIVGVQRVWDRAPHNAFTSLLAAHGRYYLAFREGQRHVHGFDGTVRVLTSDDLQNWRSHAWLSTPDVDLRDPKLSQLPDGRLLLTIGGSRYQDRVLQDRQPMVAFSDAAGDAFTAPEPARIDPAVAGPTDWLWRVTWHGGTGYGVVYQPDDGDWRAQLVATTDGRDYRHVCQLPVTGRPGEVTLRFAADGTMLALARREAGSRHAAIGSSPAPYTEWTFAELPLRLGGPDFAVLPTAGERPDGELLVGGRHYDDETFTTVLGLCDRTGAWRQLVTLPSGGDTSYPGIVVEPDRVLVAYYSSHEGKAAIYLATLRWRR